MPSTRHMIREIGTAFAVLALYLLTILAPLHQARAIQLDFAALGYQTTETGWVLCSAETERSEGNGLIGKCPAAGIAKQQLAGPPPVAGFVAPALAMAMAAVTYPVALHHLVEPRFNASAPPRAPPALA
ncbi:MAG TPA: hypothetical protein VL133_15575 [Devosia sp.]|nr:hypothetical protein [Devosia sp.]